VDPSNEITDNHDEPQRLSDRNSRNRMLEEEISHLSGLLDKELENEAALESQLNSSHINIQRYNALIENAKALLEFDGGVLRPDPLSGNKIISTNSEGDHAEFSTSLIDSSSAIKDNQNQRSVVRRGNTGLTLAQHVYDILKGTEPSPGEPGKAIHYRDLVEELNRRNVAISGRDPALTLVAHIHKDERFYRPLRGSYALQEWAPFEKSIGQRSKRRNR